jgi:predicted membrane channel-forming protein YqfA (hemolysin III family)
MEDYKEQRKRAVFYFVMTVLVVFSLWTIITSVNPMGTLAVIIVLWFVSGAVIRHRHSILEWSNSEKPLKQYIAERKEKEMQAPKIPLFNDSIYNTMDNVTVNPLSSTEEESWRKIVSSIDFDEDKKK